MTETLLAFKAGKAIRTEGSNSVVPDAIKGAIILVNNTEEGLLHFMWKNRVTNAIEEDLILFPFDASFVKVSDRVYVLKFSSSDQRHFFWMQDASSDRDQEFVDNLNGYLEDPDYTPVWNASQPHASTSFASAPASTSANPSDFQATPEQLASLQALLSSVAGGSSHADNTLPELSLSDVLTPANITPLFNSHPSLIPTLFPHLPPDLPVAPSEDAVRQIINSPNFRSAVSNFDQALRTGLLGGLVRSLGLPEEAGTGVGPFLRAIQEQADRENQDRMDTD